MKLSVCIIVKDEEEVIGRCLNCVKEFADEIIVVDTGSTDNTLEEVKKYTDKVYRFEWCNDFSLARNFSLQKATCPYTMWLDADDIITEENIKKIQELKSKIGDYDLIYLGYAVAFDGDIPTYVYERERIFKSSKNYKFEGAVHEAITPSGKILHSDILIYHKKIKERDPLRNLQIIQSKIAKGDVLDSREKFYYGRELMFCGMLKESVAIFEDFLQGDGWVVNKCECCINLYDIYLRLNDIQNAYQSLLKYLTYAPPNSKVCCLLGNMFFEREEFASAKFWYKFALTAKSENFDGGFIELDYNGYIPYMQLCVIYYNDGNIKEAARCNFLAGRLKPNDTNYLSNKKFFEKIGITGDIDD